MVLPNKLNIEKGVNFIFGGISYLFYAYHTLNEFDKNANSKGVVCTVDR